MRQQIANLHLDQVEQFRVIDQVNLVQENHDGRHADLAGQQNVLARLRHRAVRSAHHQDRAVHLRRTGDHVLHVIGVAGAIDVRVMALVALVFDVRDGDGHGLGFVTDRAALGDVGVGDGFGQALAACTSTMAAVRVDLPWST